MPFLRFEVSRSLDADSWDDLRFGVNLSVRRLVQSDAAIVKTTATEIKVFLRIALSSMRMVMNDCTSSSGSMAIETTRFRIE
jgi:hypothetical protein